MKKRAPHRITISFSGDTLTHFGGIYLLQSFFKRLALGKQLHHDLQFRQRNNRYTISEEMLALIYPISLGLGGIETSHLLKHNGVFQYLTGLPAYPNPTTLRRFLLRMAPLALPKLRTLHDRFLFSMMIKPKSPTKVIFDLDSTVLPLYGKQEMARIGYNPKKGGRPSYHPLLCFNGVTKDFWHEEFALEILILLRESSNSWRPPSVKRVTIIADKGFYDHKTIEYLESRKALFVIVAKLTNPSRENSQPSLTALIQTAFFLDKKLVICYMTSMKNLFFKKIIKEYRGKRVVFLSNPPIPYSKLRPNDLLNTRELVDFFNISRRQIYRWVHTGVLKPYKEVVGEYYFTKGDVNKFILSRRRPGRPKRRLRGKKQEALAV